MVEYYFDSKIVFFFKTCLKKSTTIVYLLTNFQHMFSNCNEELEIEKIALESTKLYCQMTWVRYFEKYNYRVNERLIKFSS